MMRSEALHSLSPKDVMIRINRQLYGEIPKGMFVTMFYAVLNIRKSCVTVASAGHNPMYWWKSTKGKHEAVKPEGVALGIDSGRRFDTIIDEVLVKLEPLDALVLYTDGVTEMMNRKNHQFGDSRLCEVFIECGSRSCEEFIARLNGSLEEFRGRAPQRDDVTVVAVRRLQESPTRVEGFTYIDGDKFLRCQVCATVNRRELQRCRSCGGRLEAPPRKPAAGATTRLQPVPGVGQCPSCKRIYKQEDISRGCPYCMRRLCANCGVRSAVLGSLCEVCASPE
jgi:hypothetical protein